MLSVREQQDLRDRAADLILNWHFEQRGALESTGPEGYGALVEAAAVVADACEVALRQWVSAARRAGLSWEEIGEALGVTRQAAQKRFGSGTHPVLGTAAGQITRTGVTADNELAVLREDGLAGRRLIGANAGRLYFEQTGRRWEHKRVLSLRRGAPISELEADGWTHVFSWYPYAYFTRELPTE